VPAQNEEQEMLRVSYMEEIEKYTGTLVELYNMGFTDFYNNLVNLYAVKGVLFDAINNMVCPH
jgi:hypothetical protein